MEPKIIFTDMDGTLLNDNKQISPITKKTLDELFGHTNKLVLSSGRPLESILQTKTKLQLHYPGLYIISYNGSLIYDCDAGHAIFESRVSMEDTIKILADAEKLGIYCHTYSSTHIISPRPSVELDFYRNTIDLPVIFSNEIGDSLSMEPFKLLAIHLQDQEQLYKLKERVESWGGDRITCAFSNDNYLEFYPVTSGKGNAVNFLCDYLNIPLTMAVAAGDAENDISMLSVIPNSFAMANASESVKKTARYVTQNDNNHDGILEVITHMQIL